MKNIQAFVIESKFIFRGIIKFSFRADSVEEVKKIIRDLKTNKANSNIP